MIDFFMNTVSTTMVQLVGFVVPVFGLWLLFWFLKNLLFSKE